MINDTNQSQSGGDGSTNIQANAIYVGVTASEARQIALDVYNANITTLSQEAASTALQRAEKLTDEFLKQVVEKQPALLEKLNDPSIQMALLDAQKVQARTGDQNLEGLLINILFDRAAESTRNLKQIALEEAIVILPRLTNYQINILSLCLLINENWSRISSLPALKWFLSIAAKFPITKIEFQSPDLLHLEVVGCMRNSTTNNKSLIYHLSTYFPGLFSKGFTEEEFIAVMGGESDYTKLLVPCPRNPDKLMLNGCSLDQLEGVDAYSHEERIKLNQAFKINLMSGQEIQEYLVQLEPAVKHLFEATGLVSSISMSQLTPVGVAIANANFTKETGFNLGWPYSMRNIS